MALSFDILTIFPGMFTGVLGESIVARAIAAGLIEVEFTDIRAFAAGRHRSVDDRPYGGGPGMVFKPEPVFAAVESVLSRSKAPPDETRRIILTPQGARLTQARIRELAGARWIILVAGHYEGFDERILEGLRSERGFEELSVGDFVLSGGEIPAMVILDGVTRLLPGAVGDPDSTRLESFEDGLLDHPQYTRPPEYRGRKVPEVLLSGNHARIEKWRREQSLERTRERRGDLLGAGCEESVESLSEECQRRPAGRPDSSGRG
jgi:tRNA (guanine37-N1)-methyltransferase